MSFEAMITKPIYKIIGLVVLLAVYVGLLPSLFTQITCISELSGMGIFGTVIGTIGALLVGAGILILLVKQLMNLTK